MRFWFSLKLLSGTFLILRIIEIWSKIHISIQVKYPLFLPDFNETWIFWNEFLKILKFKISWKSVQWEPSCSMQTDG